MTHLTPTIALGKPIPTCREKGDYNELKYSQESGESTHDIDKLLSENTFLKSENDQLKQEHLERKKD